MAILDQVKELYESNHRVGKFRGIYYDYTCPSPDAYIHQFLWDSCFHAIVLTHFDIDRAKAEIRTLLSRQRRNGFVPCITFWKHRSIIWELFSFIFEKSGITTITQPPVIPISVEAIYKKSKDTKFLKEVYPKLKGFMDWLYLNRDTNGNGLMETLHPWEAGIDSTPTFDEQLGIKDTKPGITEVYSKFYWVLIRSALLGWNNKKILKRKVFISDNVLVNSIYIKSLESMVYLAKSLGKEADSKVFSARYKKTLDSLIKYCWSEEDKIFYDLDENEMQVKIKTISSLMPLILDDLPKELADSLVIHLTDKNEFWSEYPIPSVSMDEKTFNPNRNLVLWRGPTWASTNWFISKALSHWGYGKEAKTIADKTAKMVGKSGFRENYNPLTGEGYDQQNFTWPGLVLDMISDI
jgi:glycogen debranching enzyme